MVLDWLKTGLVLAQFYFSLGRFGVWGQHIYIYTYIDCFCQLNNDPLEQNEEHVGPLVGGLCFVMSCSSSKQIWADCDELCGLMIGMVPYGKPLSKASVLMDQWSDLWSSVPCDSKATVFGCFLAPVGEQRLSLGWNPTFSGRAGAEPSPAPPAPLVTAPSTVPLCPAGYVDCGECSCVRLGIDGRWIDGFPTGKRGNTGGKRGKTGDIGEKWELSTF